MSGVTALVRLPGTLIDGDTVSGTGNQLGILLRTLADTTADCIWFVADLDAYGLLPPMLKANEVPREIGRTDELVQLVEHVPQFLSGVFLAVPEAALPVQWSHRFDTEDDPFGEMDAARFELRAFDTSYFEIGAADVELLKGLHARFGGQVEVTKSDLARD